MASKNMMNEQMHEQMVELSNIRKSFGKLEVVKGIDLNIAKGEFFSLLGPSGCGKTTLLRMIAGLEVPDDGVVVINQQSMNGVDANKRPTNMVFQSYAIFPHLNVGENVAYGLIKQRLPKAELRERVDAMLKMVDLDGYYDRPSYALSGGQRQRVALARALILEPKVLLLDEPLSALDKKLREQMQDELRRIQRTLGITFILVTHDQEEALIMSDRIAVMFDGNIAQLGTPQEIYDKPVSRRVASFIGVMNFLEGKCISKNKTSIVVDVESLGQISFPRDIIPEDTSLDQLCVGFRPEMFTILYNKKDKAENEFSSIVKNVDYYGDMSYYTLSLPNSDKDIMVSMRNTSGRYVYDLGETIRVGWRSSSLLVLN
ncbi:ABC transporter ATP-binding protein [Alphaproteobacteria bacterium]|jgi:spermidine/putrescine transport system ATP-binding protein|nr:ABC transporter ATP-binding protein [Alphaproteobacteria bacterium]MDG2467410.1 ABC transporter ATP-binding protein [Alphaproteobacteria bacterium]